ncbi:histidine phosphatase family protein [Undibacterium sp. Ji42W]|uniref:histidine phosphatase family protein n=1 Tax=Undibacterium sp. Ji42W TaxID=3413039 RepID=UPI003BEF9355
MQKSLIAFSFFCTMLFPMMSSAEPELIILVRHAEKAVENPADPSLSAAGQARVQALALALQYAGVSSIFTTQFKRTGETAQPLAQAMNITPQVLSAKRGAEHIKEVADAVRASSGTVLVVGHGNTVPAIATALGAPAMKEFCESSFSHMLVLRPAGPNMHVVQSRYGEADTGKPGLDCQ